MKGTFHIQTQATAAVSYQICKQALTPQVLEHGVGCGLYTVNYDQHTITVAGSKEIVAIIERTTIDLLPQASALVDYTAEGWLFTKNTQSQVKREDITGKYLFFSDDKQTLIDLGNELLEEYNLPVFKVPESNTPNSGKGFGFVLCVYDRNDSWRNELKKYASETIAYRYWKSEEMTASKVYSDQFKATRNGQQLTR
jgi:hypothetical protein